MIFHSQMKAGQEGPCEPFLFVEDLWRDESTSSHSQAKKQRQLRMCCKQDITKCYLSLNYGFHRKKKKIMTSDTPMLHFHF